jgi:hypothetical protein
MITPIGSPPEAAIDKAVSVGEPAESIVKRKGRVDEAEGGC